KSCRCWVPASAAFPPERRHMSNSLTIALSKGRILDDTLPLLKLAGIEPVEDLNKSRKLIFGTTDPDVRLLIVRATDVPTYVAQGAAELGVAGTVVHMAYGRLGLHVPRHLSIAHTER